MTSQRGIEESGMGHKRKASGPEQYWKKAALRKEEEKKGAERKDAETQKIGRKEKN